MSADDSLAGLNACGCGGPAAPTTPAVVDNAPGLPALAYRVGTHAQFKAAMLARLDAGSDARLRGLRTREDDDFAIALLDAWATVADVLTFYQERIANESYLRTATERVSLTHLARLIGYEPRPGVAASTYLSFHLDPADGAPHVVALPAGTRAQNVPPVGALPQAFETREDFTARLEWNALALKKTTEPALDPRADEVTLATASANLKPGDYLLLVGNGAQFLRRVRSAEPLHAAGQTRVELEAPVDGNRAEGTLPPPGIYALRARAALFGHNAPDWTLLTRATQGVYLEAHPAPGSIRPSNSDWPVTTMPDRTLDLDAVYSHLVTPGWVVILRSGRVPNTAAIRSLTERSGALYTLSGRYTRMTIDHDLPPLSSNQTRFPASMDELRQTVVLIQSERLPQADAPFDPLGPTYLTLSQPDPNLQRGQALAVTGTDSAMKQPAAELAVIADVQGTQVYFKQPLRHAFDPRTVVVNANVVPATHGETVNEVLGGGDAGKIYQRFTLRQPPLTYVSAANADGAESTLRVRIDEVLWHRVDSLLDHGPRDRVYVTRTGEDGKTTLQFGDGRTGARLTSGRDNVRAVYRKGIGRAGQVEAGTITLPITRPPGLQTVTNPLPASGAQDPETADDVRGNAPLTVVTLDRLVSLQDYEDFARAFAGIAKALATPLWVRGRRGIVLTVGGLDGAAVDPDSELYGNLLTALRQSGDPHLPVLVRTFRPAHFRLAASVKVDPDYLSERVLAAVKDRLRHAFGFAARAFGQPVMADEIIAAIQTVPGVLAVTLTGLARAETTAADRLPAAPPGVDADGNEQAAELLTLAPPPSEPTLGEMS